MGLAALVGSRGVTGAVDVVGAATQAVAFASVFFTATPSLIALRRLARSVFRTARMLVAGAMKSGQIKMEYTGNSTLPENAVLVYTGG
jgi:hypothetical protein